jgi:Tfp pilus assembly protein PilF
MPRLRRALRLLLVTVAVAYAALACLRTVADFDTGWHLATGRYVLEHRAVPSTDVLSYTSAGEPWHYPPFAGSLLYAFFQRFGYAGLSWFSAAAAALLAAYLLWRAASLAQCAHANGRGGERASASIAAAVLLVLAVPSLAYRLTPRADLFTTLFFAIFLAELWRFHCGERVRLWLFPALMLLWVNLHPGFIAGLGLVAAYVASEAMMLPFRELRDGARRRLASSWPWLAAAVAAVLINPWGWGALRQARELAGLGGGAHASSQAASLTSPRLIGELSGQPLSWHNLALAFQLRDPDSGFWWLLLAAVAAFLWALWRRELGAALLLAASMAAAVQKLRFQGLFSIVVIVVGGTLLAESFETARNSKRAIARRWVGVALESALLAVLCAVTALRIGDLVSDRYYVVSASTSNFGAGESWWFPERAAEFIEREKLPGNIFQPYNLGGFTALRLGPRYPDYIDGRGVRPEVSAEEQLLLTNSPDSALWEQVAERRKINIVLFSLARYGGLGTFDLNAFCDAEHWRPVYLDEVSLVLMRRTAQNQPWLERLEVNCHKAVFAPANQAPFQSLYNFYANSGAVYYALARDNEAEAAWQRALQMEPDDPNIHLFMAQLYQQQMRSGDAEREYRAALERGQSAIAWYALGRLLATEHRYAEAEPAIAAAAEMSAAPANQYKALGQVQLHLNPRAALASFEKAERAGPSPANAGPGAREFRVQLADGRAAAWLALHDPVQATVYAEEALHLAPEPKRWLRLADCYAAQGRSAEAEQARSRAGAAPAK